MATVISLAREGSATLRESGVATAARDAELLLAHVLGSEPARLHARPNDPVPSEAEARFRVLVSRRAVRIPLQYLTGFQEFWSLRLRVTPAVLIPRPETEGLVEAFLRLNRRPDPLVLDVGTGSGCLAIAVAREAPGARIHATDLSPEALEVAARNAAEHEVAGRIRFHQGDLFAPLRAAGLSKQADFILSNPPYVGETELQGLEPEVRIHEPRGSLTPGADPLLIHRRLATGASGFLRSGGLLIVEIGAGQEAALRALYSGAPGLEVVEVRPDLAGIPRVLVARG